MSSAMDILVCRGMVAMEYDAYAMVLVPREPPTDASPPRSGHALRCRPTSHPFSWDFWMDPDDRIVRCIRFYSTARAW